MVAVTAFAVAGLVLAADGAEATEPGAPQPAPMMGAVEPPETTDDPGLTPLLQAAGAALVLGGGVTVARGWVSPDAAG